MSESLTFYDLPTKGNPQPWSLNPWKTRMALNYKGLNYKTEWTEYPDVAPKAKEFGLGPNSEGTPYTIPILRFDQNTVVMDSQKIAQELEKRHPSPSLHLDTPYLPKVGQVLGAIFGSIAGIVLPGVPSQLPERSEKYFDETREKAFGMPLSKLYKEKDTPETWNAYEEQVKKWIEMLKENNGPYFEGEKVTYADFVVVTFLIFLKFSAPQYFEKTMKLDGSLQKLWDGCEKWMQNTS